jgi:predicted DNA-binding transcriptional regulator AlpA
MCAATAQAKDDDIIDPLIDINKVSQMLDISKSRVFALVAEGKLIRPIKLHSRCSRWRTSEILAFIEECAVASRT